MKIIPQLDIDLSSLLNAHEIKRIMKDNKIKFYCYLFIYKGIIMKVGMSADNDYLRGSFGERIYRQSFHIPGWPKCASKNSAGNDMLDVIENFPGINKNDVCIKVFDLTNIDFAVKSNPKKEVNDFEKALLEWHEKTYGCIPIGNLRDERLMPKKSQVTDLVFGSLFDEE
jgi:hypothetical protein